MNKNKKYVFISTILSFFILISVLCFFSARWYIKVYGDIGFESIIYTLTAGLQGVQSGLVKDYLLSALLPTVIVSALFSVLLFLRLKKEWVLPICKTIKIIFPFRKIVSICMAIVIIVVFFVSACVSSGFDEYVFFSIQDTEIFESKFTEYNNKNVTFKGEKKNLIYIYLESMETTYFSSAEGGALNHNVIPELYTLAKENINFSHNNDVGGFIDVTGTGWTMGAMVAQSGGIPLKVDISLGENTYGKTNFLSGATTVIDILKENNYYQAVMFGSYSSFANRDTFYREHGVSIIYDVTTARQDGIVPEDYSVWWGMEDEHLYTYAKEELLKIAEVKTPFAFTMLTADTHHVDGYYCNKCQNNYGEQYENVLSCASRQLLSFVQWIKEQSFYEDTVIVICGDHITMDSEYISRNVDPNYTRHVYNCIINSSVQPINTNNRQFCAMDMFPTTLAAMGCTIENNRLALGTNLFSNAPTLIEEMGHLKFDEEMRKNSKYYTEVIAKIP